MNNIPKICYLYWNDLPMSFLHYCTVLSFLKLNKDWKIIIYTIKHNESVDNNELNPKYINYNGIDFFPLLKTLPRVEIYELVNYKKNVHSILISDIWRREILYSNGGVYSDFDVLWLKPMDEFINIDHLGSDIGTMEGIVSFYSYKDGFHNVSNLIFEKESLFLKTIIDTAQHIPPPYSDQSFGTELLNRMYPNWASVSNNFPRMVAIKYETFYPYSTFNMDQLFIDTDLTPLKSKNTMCIHWFNGNPISKDYINKEDYTRNCSMTSILKQEGYL